MIKKVAFSGKMGAGKSFAYEIIAMELIEKVYPFSFARKLKEIAEDLFDINTTNKDKDVRHILQEFGSYMRLIDEDVWINYLFSVMKRHAEYYEKFPLVVQVIDDLRYKNEFWRLKKEGFILIRLNAPAEVRYNRIKHNITWEDFLKASEHPSETDLDDIPADEWNLILDSGKNKEDMHNDFRVNFFGKGVL